MSWIPCSCRQKEIYLWGFGSISLTICVWSSNTRPNPNIHCGLPCTTDSTWIALLTAAMIAECRRHYETPIAFQVPNLLVTCSCPDGLGRASSLGFASKAKLLNPLLGICRLVLRLQVFRSRISVGRETPPKHTSLALCGVREFTTCMPSIKLYHWKHP